MKESAFASVFAEPSERIDLIIFTGTFPYGKGEKPFLIPEVEALSNRFRVTVVSQASKELQDDVEHLTVLPKAVNLLVIPSFSLVDYARAALGALSSRLFRSEMRDLASDGFSINRLIDSLKTVIEAEAFRLACVKRGIFTQSENKIYYSFWFTYKLLALCLESDKRAPSMRIWGRLNGFDLYNERNSSDRQPFQRVMRDHCSKVLFGASTAQDYFIRHFGPEKTSGQYMLNRLGVSEGVRFSRLRSLHPFLLVSCSNVIPLKRVSLIADAVSRLGNPDICWVHFGDGQDLPMIKSIIDKAQCNAWLPGAVSNDRVLSFYREHAVGCFIALSETEGGCPVSLQEALSFGLPAIVTAAGGAQYEGVDENGVLLPDSIDADDVAAAIEEVFQLDDSSWTRMSNRSLEIWRERFDVRICKRQLLDALDTAVDIE